VKTSRRVLGWPGRLLQQPCLASVAVWEQAVYLSAAPALAPSAAETLDFLRLAAVLLLSLTGPSAASRCVSCPARPTCHRASSAGRLGRTIQLRDLRLNLAQI
jgi:hypothetical protein